MPAPVKQLRNHIPIASPARREPVDGSESPMRVSLGFTTEWYAVRCAVDMGERWHQDPFFRREQLRTMKRELIERFPEAELWDDTDDRDLATISGVYGAYVVPHVFGMPLIYSCDRWPEADPAARLTTKDIEALTPQSVLASRPFEELLEQMEVVSREWGVIHGYPNWQGVLNTAFTLRGQEIFLDMYERPNLARAFFALIAEVMIAAATTVQERQRVSGFAVNQFSISNCVVNMVSPDDYTEFIRPQDERIGSRFDRFGVHTCNWNIDPYVPALSSLPRLGYIDMGTESNLAAARSAFPDARRAVIYSPWTLQRAPLERIRDDMARIRRELSPCDVVLADIADDTSDERVRDVLRICRELEEVEVKQ